MKFILMMQFVLLFGCNPFVNSDTQSIKGRGRYHMMMPENWRGETEHGMMHGWRFGSSRSMNFGSKNQASIDKGKNLYKEN